MLLLLLSRGCNNQPSPSVATAGSGWRWERHRLNSRMSLSQPCLPSNHRGKKGNISHPGHFLIFIPHREFVKFFYHTECHTCFNIAPSSTKSHSHVNCFFSFTRWLLPITPIPKELFLHALVTVNSLTAKSVPAGTKNSRPVGFYSRNSTKSTVNPNTTIPQIWPPWWCRSPLIWRGIYGPARLYAPTLFRRCRAGGGVKPIYNLFKSLNYLRYKIKTSLLSNLRCNTM